MTRVVDQLGDDVRPVTDPTRWLVRPPCRVGARPAAAVTGLEDALEPVTVRIGFLEAPTDDVAAALRAWRAQIHGAADVEHLSGGLRENVGRLEPLTGRVRPRELVVGTAGGRWAALFDCGVAGGDPVASVGHLSRSMGVQGVVVVRVAEGAVGAPAARQLQLFGPLPTDFLNYVRTVSVVQDGSRWRFDAGGVVQAFEEVEAYAARRVEDRLTAAMLRRYCRALGLEPFDPDFYAGPSSLVANSSVPGPGAPVMSREQARRRWWGTVERRSG